MGVGLCALSAALCQTVPALAEDAQDLGKMVVSANRTATSVDTVGSSVTVITADEIAKKQAITALDAIKDVPGINMYSNGGKGKSTGLYMRGMGYKNILILIDGVEVADPSGTQSTYDLTHLQADNIERIEVLRGNQSTLYGSDAMGGVISITTKSGRGSKKPFGGTAAMEYGTYNTRKGDVNVQGESGPVYYSGSVRSLMTDGFDISNTTPGDEKDGYKNTGGDLRVGSDVLTGVGVLDRLNIEGIARILRADTQLDGNSGKSDSIEQYRMFQRSASLSSTADMFGGMLSNHVAASLAQSRRDYYMNHTRKLANPFYDGNKTKYEYQGTLKPIDDHTFVFGADREREQMATYNQAARAVTDDGMFANYQLDLLDKSMTLTFGARQDDHEMFGDYTTYRGTLGYRLKETGTRFHTSYGTGFRAPSLFELYSSYGKTTLKPEESSGYDLGVEQSFLDDRLTLDSTFFNNRMTNEIIYDSNVSKYNNVASSRTFGFENTASLDISREWKTSVSHTYQQARDNSTGQVLGGRPHNVGSARVSYSPDEVPGLDTWVSSRMSSWSYSQYGQKKYTGGYAVIDFGASYPINDWASVYGRVENITDKFWHTTSEYAETGRAGYAGVRMKF
jgi:vitamin B12 transporter